MGRCLSVFSPFCQLYGEVVALTGERSGGGGVFIVYNCPSICGKIPKGVWVRCRWDVLLNHLSMKMNKRESQRNCLSTHDSDSTVASKWNKHQERLHLEVSAEQKSYSTNIPLHNPAMKLKLCFRAPQWESSVHSVLRQNNSSVLFGSLIGLSAIARCCSFQRRLHGKRMVAKFFPPTDLICAAWQNERD